MWIHGEAVACRLPRPAATEMARVRRQPVGQRTASRSRSDDDKIEFQLNSPQYSKLRLYFSLMIVFISLAVAQDRAQLALLIVQNWF
jgi:hypothetical protein